MKSDFFKFRAIGEQARERDKRERIRFFTHCLFEKFTSHTHWSIYRQSSVPAIAGLLLGVVVALILIPISTGILLLLWTTIGIISSIATHRSPRPCIGAGSFRHITIVHLARWSFHTSVWLVLLHWIHAKATIAHAHLIRWSTKRLIIVRRWSTKCSKAS